MGVCLFLPLLPEDEARPWLPAISAVNLVAEIGNCSDEDAAEIIIRRAGTDMLKSRCRQLRHEANSEAQIYTPKNCLIAPLFWRKFEGLHDRFGSNWQIGDFITGWMERHRLDRAYVFGAEFDENDLRAIFPAVVEAPRGKATVSPVQGARRGAKRKDWWDHLWIEMIRRIQAGSLKPGSKGELQKILETWCDENRENYGDSTLKPMASNLFDFLEELRGK